MSDAFVYFRPTGEPVEVDLAKLMNVAALRLVVGDGPYDITQDGEVVGDSMTRSRTLKRLRHLLQVGDVGPTYRVRNSDGEVIFRCREVKPAIEVIDTNGNDKADLYWSTIVAEFPQYHPRFAGAYVCKQIAGSSQLSQHGYGNAVDIFFDTLAHQEVVADWVVAHADEMQAEHVISLKRIWSRGVGWHAYTGETHYHLHTDFHANCSGPCGVKSCG